MIELRTPDSDRGALATVPVNYGGGWRRWLQKTTDERIDGRRLATMAAFVPRISQQQVADKNEPTIKNFTTSQ